MDSIFSTLKSYVPSTARDPQEDYLTQLLAWLLANTPGLGAKFSQMLLQTVNNPTFTVAADDQVMVETQVVVVGGRIDMLLKIGPHGFICEHKVTSGLAEQQIKRYVDSFSMHAGTFYSVLITATTLQHTQPADIKLVWADVCEFLVRERENYDGEFGFLLDHTILFLRQQGLGRIEPLTMENLLGYIPGSELVGKLESLLPKLLERDWTAACPGLAALNQPSRYAPVFHKSRWGRIGIDFFPQTSHGWQPGLFAGVLLNGYDHALTLVDTRLGPDLVVFLEYDYYPKANSPGKMKAMTNRAQYLSHPNYQELCTRLMVQSGAFRFQREVPRSPWRILVFQQPLVNVIQSTESERDQLDRIFDACCQGISLITQDDLLAAIPRA